MITAYRLILEGVRVEAVVETQEEKPQKDVAVKLFWVDELCKGSSHRHGRRNSSKVDFKEAYYKTKHIVNTAALFDIRYL